MTILAFLIIADILGLILFTFFPVSDSSVFKIANFDLIVSILLIIGLIFNKYVFKTDTFIDSAKNSIISFFAFVPVYFIGIHISGIHPGLYIWIFWVICRILHIIGLFGSLKFLGSKFISYTKTNNLDYGIIATFGVFIACAIIFYLVEAPINPMVGNFEDAIWYSLASITSTGYGDITPITGFGRLVGSIIIIAGVAFTSFATASVASTIVNDMNEKREKSKDGLLNFYNEINAKFLEIQNQINDLKKYISENQKDLKDNDLIIELSTKVSENQENIFELKEMVSDLTKSINSEDFEAFDDFEDLIIDSYYTKMNSKKPKSNENDKKDNAKSKEFKKDKSKKSKKDKKDKSKKSKSNKSKKDKKDKSKKSKSKKSKKDKKDKSKKSKSKKSKKNKKTKFKKSNKDKSNKDKKDKSKKGKSKKSKKNKKTKSKKDKSKKTKFKLNKNIKKDKNLKKEI